MTKYIETTGKTEDEAIAAALAALGLDRDDVRVEIIDRAKTGFLGIGSIPAKVRVSYDVPDEIGTAAAPEPKPREERKPREDRKPRDDRRPREERKPRVESAPREERKPERPVQESAPRRSVETSPVAEDDENAAKVCAFLSGLLEHMDIAARIDMGVTAQGSYRITLTGANMGAVIGRRGETLDAIQQLTSYSVNRGRNDRLRIHIDAENYRAKREESLERLALRMADKVKRSRRSMTLESMNAYERHVIHTALQDVAGVMTQSTGVEPNRRVVVLPQ